MRLSFAPALALALLVLPASGAAAEVRLRDMGRFAGDQETALVGYGIVVGLSGTGDSPRNPITQQTLSNVLGRLGLNIAPDQVQSRNVAAVMVTAKLPSSAHLGDHLDVSVSSLADARSLVGGSLLMTTLSAGDQRAYAQAQGPVIVGGFRFDADLNREQRNSPGSGGMAGGAVVITESRSGAAPTGDMIFILDDPDFVTASRIAAALNAARGSPIAEAADAASVRIQVGALDRTQLAAWVEGISVEPEGLARVVVNERSGTVVAGADVRISSVVISQGDIRVSVEARNEASQPGFYAGRGDEVRSLVVTNTRLNVASERDDAVMTFPSSTVADLVEGLHRAKVDTRGVISILQAMKSAGALHADIIVQ